MIEILNKITDKQFKYIHITLIAFELLVMLFTVLLANVDLNYGRGINIFTLTGIFTTFSYIFILPLLHCSLLLVVGLTSKKYRPITITVNVMFLVLNSVLFYFLDKSPYTFYSSFIAKLGSIVIILSCLTFITQNKYFIIPLCIIIFMLRFVYSIYIM